MVLISDFYTHLQIKDFIWKWMRNISFKSRSYLQKKGE